ncbi:MAG TPA: transcription antitermination factor NusB [Clostridiales bacterium]|nr:transcription antitermination factor NusB [Clostridiales bacterium]
MSRKDTREELMKLLYMVDINDTINDFDLDKYLDYLEIMVDVDYFRRTAENFRQHVLEIDRLIDIYSNDWKLNRIARIDFAILRLAVCEMEFDDSIPVSVSINEAVEISKKYSSSDAHKFINGILGNISRRTED